MRSGQGRLVSTLGDDWRPLIKMAAALGGGGRPAHYRERGGTGRVGAPNHPDVTGRHSYPSFVSAAPVRAEGSALSVGPQMVPQPAR